MAPLPCRFWRSRSIVTTQPFLGCAYFLLQDDTPLRDGNRDRLIGLLTERAARTLLYYLFELNPTTYGWFSAYMKSNPIPKDGNWNEVSGEAFIRQLLSMPIEETRWGETVGRNPMYDNTRPIGVDPRNLAQRIMEIRTQIAREWREELRVIDEENALLMRETLLSSFSLGLTIAPISSSSDDYKHPELEPDDSAAGSDD